MTSNDQLDESAKPHRRIWPYIALGVALVLALSALAGGYALWRLERTKKDTLAGSVAPHATSTPIFDIVPAPIIASAQPVGGAFDLMQPGHVAPFGKIVGGVEFGEPHPTPGRDPDGECVGLPGTQVPSGRLLRPVRLTQLRFCDLSAKNVYTSHVDVYRTAKNAALFDKVSKAFAAKDQHNPQLRCPARALQFSGAFVSNSAGIYQLQYPTQGCGWAQPAAVKALAALAKGAHAPFHQ